MEFAQIKQTVAQLKDDMLNAAIELGSIPGVNPRMGGEGEAKRVAWLQAALDGHGIPYTVFAAKDSAVPEGERQSVIVRIAGSEQTDKTLWFIAHLDTVAPGDPNAWHTPPFKPTIKEGKLYGLGVEDNGQAVISIMYTCAQMKRLGLQPKCNIGFLFAADEETGSQYGLRALATAGVFGPRDEAVVPDCGSSEGTFIEVAEKSLLWVEFTITGKQAHGSMPHLGINASSVGCRLGVELEDTLKEKYAYKDALFDPPYSTFEITMKHANVDSPNVLPGRDVFAMDMRILPKFSPEEVLDTINRVISKYEYRYNVKISCAYPQRADAAPGTSPESAIASTLTNVLRAGGIQAYCGGIGGGTCAGILREYGMPAVVWSTLDELAHQPNEYLIIDNLVQDTAVFLAVIQEYC
ncbi:MAG: M20 family metallo-hydrolase [Christensenellaceae bacterium]|jgi:succinyl-diaminopimelate desuccinylase|nr:M20 family metallo-hydrolase [Christensenellaceae bacterium]